MAGYTIPKDTTNYFGYNSPGIGAVGSYQVSGYPFLTGTINMADTTEEKVSFPGVTKSITIRNHSPATYLKVHFASDAGGTAAVIGAHHYITVSGSAAKSDGEETLNVKCNEIYLTNDCGTPLTYELHAEITTIAVSEMFELTGSGISA
jgi:hypothetical protein|tara:strand:+ start:607 stop:1053 length:447 start_codon:yes stop_codon:yes gene_type:complete